ncbi:MAG: histidine--tRNA ligase [Methylococcaceae bacterium]
MSNKIQAVRGMHDILPEQTPNWHYVEATLRDVFAAYGYQEIRLPIVEKTELFKRSIGEVTDIVEKEMYTFEDRSGDSLTLRPEGTAGCLRACIEHGLLHNQVQRLWYYGPMFRHERPQAGRYRQFYQVGLETYGMPGPDIDAEIIALTYRLWKRLGVQHKMQLQLNSLGTSEERLIYREKLITYLKGHEQQLDEDSRRRLDTNPLRILDSKNPEMAQLIKDAPVLLEYLGSESSRHFNELTEFLRDLDIQFELNTRLVRGLDYYCNTVFEWVTDSLGAQGTVCAGGRYDGLIAQLGGRGASAIGFAMGIERLVALLDEQKKQTRVDGYLVCVGGGTVQQGIKLAEQLRDALPEFNLILNCGGGSYKSQFKKADKCGANYALVLGEDEIANQRVSIKSLRQSEEQVIILQTEAVDHFKHILNDTTISKY